MCRAVGSHRIRGVRRIENILILTCWDVDTTMSRGAVRISISGSFTTIRVSCTSDFTDSHPLSGTPVVEEELSKAISDNADVRRMCFIVRTFWLSGILWSMPVWNVNLKKWETKSFPFFMIFCRYMTDNDAFCEAILFALLFLHLLFESLESTGGRRELSSR